MSSAMNGIVRTLGNVHDKINNLESTLLSLSDDIVTQNLSSTNIFNDGNLVNSGNVDLGGSFVINTNKFTVSGFTGNTTISGSLNVSGTASLGSTTVSALTNNGSLVNAGNATFGGVITVVGSAKVNSLISNSNSMVRQPYMPFDEITVKFDGNDEHSIITQTNYLSGSYDVVATKNSTGNYTFVFTASNHGTKTFDLVYLSNFVPTETASLATHLPSDDELSCLVNTYNLSNEQVNAAGYYTFRIRSSNQSNMM